MTAPSDGHEPRRVRKTGNEFLDNLLLSLEDEAVDGDFSVPVTYTYMLGVYLALNALQDAYLLVEGPDCTYMKAQYLQGNHDWLSTLTNVSGFHRIANTALHPAMMTESREEPLRALMNRMAATSETAGLLLTTMPMAFITGADYERLCRDVAAASGKEVIHIPGLSLSGDWVDGYAKTLESLARQLAVPKIERGPRKVAVVGYLFDRNEDDHLANLAELRRMFAALELELVSVWLSGQRFGELHAVAQADTIVSLPYGGRAARLLARRTGAQVLELPLPMGLAATEQWLRTLGERFDREKAAEAFLDAELGRIAPRVEWIVPFIFQGLRFGYVGDPYLFPGVREILETLGATLDFVTITNRAPHAKGVTTGPGGPPPLVAPSTKAFFHALVGHVADHRLDLLVTNNASMNMPLPHTTMVEFGFPSVFQHALYDRPFLGFRGFLAFVDTLANALRMDELRHSQRKTLNRGHHG
jgi:nitrogenase molybdenum-iron protein alpha/beta subunit